MKQLMRCSTTLHLLKPAWDAKMRVPMTVEEAYETNAFKLLAQGMKNDQALLIIFTLNSTVGAFVLFERWAKEELNEQADKIGTK